MEDEWLSVECGIEQLGFSFIHLAGKDGIKLNEIGESKVRIENEIDCWCPYSSTSLVAPLRLWKMLDFESSLILCSLLRSSSK